MGDGWALLATARPDPRRIQEALDRSYRGVDAEPGPAQRVLSYVFNAFRVLIDHLFRALTGDGVSAGITLVAWLIVAVLAFLAVRAVMRLRLVPDRRIGKGRDGSADIDWHARAEAAMSAGDHREAVRALYRALVAAMSRRGIVQDEPSLTAGDCRRFARRARPELAPAIERATGIYERVTYGLGEFDQPDLQQMREAEQEVLRR